MSDNATKTHWGQYFLTTVVAIATAIGGLKGLLPTGDAKGPVAAAPSPTVSSAPALVALPTAAVGAMPPLPAPTHSFEALPFPTPRLTLPPHRVPVGEWDAPPAPAQDIPEASFPDEPKENRQYKTADAAMNAIYGEVRKACLRLDHKFGSTSFERNLKIEQRAWLWQRVAEWDAGRDKGAILCTLRRTKFLQDRYDAMPK